MQASSQRYLGALAALLLTVPVAAQTRSIKSYLPESTVVSISLPDIKTSLAEMQQMPLLKMWAEDEVQDFVADVMKMAEDWIEQGMEEARAAREMGMMPFDPDELTKLSIDSMTFAVTKLDVEVGQFGPSPNIGIIMHMDFGDSAPIWNQIVPMGLAMAEQGAAGMLTSETSRIGDVQLTTLIPQGPEEQQMSLNVAMVGSGMVFGTLKDEVVSTIENFLEDRPVLARSGTYRSAFDRVDNDGAEIEVYVRPQPLMDFGMMALKLAAQMEPGFPQELDIDGIERALEALGVRGVEALGMACVYDGDTSVTNVSMVVPPNKRQGILAVSDTELDLDFLPWVPKDAASFSASTFDVSGIWDTAMKALEAYDPGIADEFLGHLSEIEGQLGMSVRNDLFGALGKQFVTWSMPMGGAIAVAPEMAILMEVENQDALLNSFQIMSQLSQGAFEIDEVERRGITAYQISINMDPTGGMGMNPLAMYIPTFAFKNGYMVMGFSAGDVKRVFDRMDREPDPQGDVRGNAEFAPYLERLPRSGLNSVSFTDWKANFEGIYQMATGVLALVPVTDDIPLDFALLPDSSTLTQHLAGGISYGVTDEKGFLSTSFSPFGPEIVAIGVGLGAVGVAIYNSFR